MSDPTESMLCAAAKSYMNFIDACFDAGVKLELRDEEIYFIMYLFRCQGREDYQIHALDILCKISFNFPHMLRRFIEFNLVPVFLRVAWSHFERDALSFKCFGILELAQALTALDPNIRDEIIKSGIFDAIKPCMHYRVWTASWFVCLCLPPTNPNSLRILIPVIVQVLKCNFPQSQTFILMALNSIISLEDKFLQALCNKELLTAVNVLRSHESRIISRLALQVSNAINNAQLFDDEFLTFFNP